MRNAVIRFVSGVAATAVGLSVQSARGAILTFSSPEEAMVFSGSPNTVWDPKGAVEISSNGLNKGYGGGNPTTGAGSTNVEYALMSFNTSSFVAQANSAYGAGNWFVTGVGLTLYSNFATGGVYSNNSVFNEIEPGNFSINWISNNGWTGDQVTWNNLSNYLPGVGNNLEEAQGTFGYPANGTSPEVWPLTPTADLLNDINGGGIVSFLGTPADSSVGYLFNTPMQGNPAVLDITIAQVPEPATPALAAFSALAGLLIRRRRIAQAHPRKRCGRTI